MTSSEDSTSVILTDLMVGPLALPTQRLAGQSTLKLKFSTEDAKLQKCMNISTESEDDIWTVEGSVNVSSSARQFKMSISIEEDGWTTELCNATVSCVDLAKHARERPKDSYEVLLDDATPSAIMLVTCMTKIPSLLEAAALEKDSTSIVNSLLEELNLTTSGRDVTTLSQGLPEPPASVSNAEITSECAELERRYEEAKLMPSESRAYALNAVGSDYLDLVDAIDDVVVLYRAIHILEEAVQCSFILDQHRRKYFTDLSTALLTRFYRTKDPTALESAITAGQDAVSITDQMLHIKRKP